MSKLVFILTISLFSVAAFAKDDLFEIIDLDRSYLLQRKLFLLVKTETGPIWIIPRSQAQIDYLTTNPVNESDSKDPYRSIKPEFFVVKPLCVCSGTLPRYMFPDEGFLKGIMPGGFWCAQDQSLFDISGRVIASNCDTTNFVIPEYEYLDDNTIKVFKGDT